MRETSRQSAILLGWIEENLTTLSGLVLLVDNSASLDLTTFNHALDSMELHTTIPLTSSKAVLDLRGGSWHIRYASAAPAPGAGYPVPGEAPSPVLARTLQVASEKRNFWHMSEPFADLAGRHHVYLARVTANREDVAVAAVLDLEDAVSTLFDASQMRGLDLELRLQAADSAQALPLRLVDSAVPPALVQETHLSTAQARLDLRWLVAADYAGGVDRTLTYGVWVVGTLLSLLIALYVANLRSANARIQKRVDAATQDLQTALTELQRSETQLRHILNTSPLGIAVSVEGITRMANPAMRSMFNIAVGSFIPALYVDPEARQRIRQTLFKEGSVRGVELQMFSASGAVRDYLSTFMLTEYEGEQAVLGWLLDITDLKAAGQAARLAQAAAEEASRVKSDFLANMSHEIRTPMNAIIGLSGLALKNDMAPRIHDYLVKIRRSGEHLLGIINDVLDFSKIESGKLEIEAIAFELESVIENVVNLISRSAEDKGLELLCSVDSNIPRTLIGDPLRVGQILINYANNAVKFTEKGEVRMAIALREQSEHEVLLHFSVTDTGIGLSEDQMGRLFKSFVQADSSTTRNYGGTGLGLAVSKSLAHAMGGQVGVESTLGRGAAFWFTVRFGIGSEEKMRAQPRPDLRGRRVLVVDDSEASALILSDMLSELGFSVAHVNSGQAALELLGTPNGDEQPFEFLIVDWLMPAMDGLETVQAIQNLQLKTPPFTVMVTAHRRPELVQGAERLGIDHVLSKPVNSSLLVNTLMQVEGLLPASPPLALPNAGHSALEARLAAIGGARILLVEDNEINQQVACELLWDVGFEVDVADNGQIALHSVEARSAEGLPYDIVLMDMQMPVMDGVTAARLIRETRSSEELPIVAMTANAMQADRERCMAAGMNGFVTKPINPEELWQALLTSVKVRDGLGPVAKATLPPLQPGADAQLVGLLQALRHIPELDVAQGLLRTNDNPAFYASLLRKLVASQADAVVRVRQALQTQDPGSAERYAHTLKGVAGNLGASTLQKSADVLESALRQCAPDAALAAAIDHTEATLVRLIAALRATPGLLEAASPAPTQALSDAEKTAALQITRQIEQLLRQDDAQAAELWEANAQALRALYPDADKIGAAIQAFDFEDALALLEAHSA